MKRQWSLILAILFALMIAVFAVINVEPVQVDYVFGTAEWPLILIILGSVLMGGFIIASAGVFRIFSIQRRLKTVEKENMNLKSELEVLKNNAQDEPSMEEKEDDINEDNQQKPNV